MELQNPLIDESRENPVCEERKVVFSKCQNQCCDLKGRVEETRNTADQDMNKLADSQLEITIERLREALEKANRDLSEYIQERSKGIKYPMLLGPNIGDLTYFYRLGNVGTNDQKGMNLDELEEGKSRIIKQGFPEAQFAEVDLINFTSYFSRAETLPNKAIVVKHFPGGNEFLEITEESGAAFTLRYNIASAVENYRAIVNSDTPPEGIMISHGTYNLEQLPNTSQEFFTDPELLHPWIRNLDLSEIPASFNPFFAKYLRQKMQYDGLIIPDWYDMGAVQSFLIDRLVRMSAHLPEMSEFVENGFGRRSSMSIWALFLAVDAGMSCAAGIESRDIQNFRWDALAEKYPQEYKRFADKIGILVGQTFEKIKPTSIDITFDSTKFSMAEKAYLFTHVRPRREDPKNPFSRKQDQDPYKQAVFDIFADYGIGDYDIWNRTGILTLIQRQKIIEQISGRKFADLPKPYPDENIQKQAEEKWFFALMNDPDFRKYYDSVDWNSPEIQQLFIRQSKALAFAHTRQK